MHKITIYIEGQYGFDGQDNLFGFSLGVGFKPGNESKQVKTDKRLQALLSPWRWRKLGRGESDRGFDLPSARHSFDKANAGFRLLEKDGCTLVTKDKDLELCLAMQLMSFAGEEAFGAEQSTALDQPAPDKDPTNVTSWPAYQFDLARLPGPLGRPLNLLGGFRRKRSFIYYNSTRYYVRPWHLVPSFEFEADNIIYRFRAGPNHLNRANGTWNTDEDDPSSGRWDYKLDNSLKELDLKVSAQIHIVDPRMSEEKIESPKIEKTGFISFPNPTRHADGETASPLVASRDWLAELTNDIVRVLDFASIYVSALRQVTKQDPDDDSATTYNLEEPDRHRLTKALFQFASPSLAIGLPILDFEQEQEAINKDRLRKSLLFDAVQQPGSADNPVLNAYEFDKSREENKRILKPLLDRASAIDLFTAAPTENIEWQALKVLISQVFETAKALGHSKLDELNPFKDNPTPGNPLSAESLRAHVLALEELLRTMTSNEFARRLVHDLVIDEIDKIEKKIERTEETKGILDGIKTNIDNWLRQLNSEDTPRGGANQPLHRIRADRIRRAILENPFDHANLPSDDTFQGQLLEIYNNIIVFLDGNNNINSPLEERLAAIRKNIVALAAHLIAKVTHNLDLNDSDEPNREDREAEEERDFNKLMTAVREQMIRIIEQNAETLIGPANRQKPKAESNSIDDGGDSRQDDVILEPLIISERPEPIVITVGDVMAPASNTDTGNTYQRYAGIGGLVRTVRGTDTGKWHALTSGASVLRKAMVSNEEFDPIVLGFGHSAFRVVEQDGLQNVTIVDDGEPLTAMPPGTEAVDTAITASELRDGNSDDIRKNTAMRRIAVIHPDADLICHICAAGNDDCKVCATDELQKFVPLKYGETREYAFFVQKNNAFLPRAVSQEEDPVIFRLPNGKTDNLPNLPKDVGGRSTTLKVRHLRRTPVGPPRLVSPKTIESPRERKRSLEAFKPPEFDRKTVHPLTDLLYGDPDRDIGRPLNVKSRQRNELVLLRGSDDDVFVRGKREVSIGLLPPACSLVDYQRWRFRDLTGMAGEKKKISAEIIATLDAFELCETEFEHENAKACETAPDDPAVSRLGFRLSRIELRYSGAGTNQQVRRPFTVTSISQQSVELPPWPRNNDNLLAAPTKITIKAHERGKGEESIIVSGDRNKGFEITVSVCDGELYQIDLVSLVDSKYFAEPQDTTNDARFRGRPEELHISRRSIVEADNAADEDQNTSTQTNETDQCAAPADWEIIEGHCYVEAAAHSIDVEVADSYMPSQKDLFNRIALLDEADGHLYVGFDAPQLILDTKSDEDDTASVFKFVSTASLSRQRWHWTGREIPTGLSNGGDSEKILPDLRELTRDIWRADKDQTTADTRRTTRALIEPDWDAYASPPDTTSPSFEFWAKLAGADGAYFADISDSERFVERGRWPTLAPSLSEYPGSENDKPGSARRERGLPLAHLKLNEMPKAEYWRFSAEVVNRYAGLMSETHTDRRVTTPWRRVLIAPDIDAYKAQNTTDPTKLCEADDMAEVNPQLPAPRLHLLVPLPAPLDTNTSVDEGGEWTTFLAVFDEPWGDEAGLAEFIDAMVLTAGDAAGEGNPSGNNGDKSNELGDIFRPVSPDVPEFGFDPILTTDSPLSVVPENRKKDPGLYNAAVCALTTGGVPMGLTFDSGTSVVPVRSMAELKIRKSAFTKLPGLKHSEGNRLFAKLKFRRRVSGWDETGKGSNTVISADSRSEWAIFSASNQFWRYCYQDGGEKEFTARADSFVLDLGSDGESASFYINDKRVLMRPTEPYKPIQDAPDDDSAARYQTRVRRRLFAILTLSTTGAAGSNRSEYFLGLGLIPDNRYDFGKNFKHFNGVKGQFGDKTSDYLSPLFWLHEETIQEHGKLFVRLIETEFHIHDKRHPMDKMPDGIMSESDMYDMPFGNPFDHPERSEGEETDHPFFGYILGPKKAPDIPMREDAIARVVRISPRLDVWNTGGMHVAKSEEVSDAN